MVLLIDANIVLDYLLRREPFYKDAKRVMELCSTEKADGLIALHTVTTIWYVLRKVNGEQRRRALRSVCELLEVTGTSHKEVIKAIEMEKFSDFEDCIQSKCAKSAQADYIITRNTGDFSYSEVRAITPEELFKMIE